jgi:hypothetical protein
MIKIDLQKIRDTLPSNSVVKILKREVNGESFPYIECQIEPSLYHRHPIEAEKDFNMIKEWQRQIVGEALSEFYTYTECGRWAIYLKPVTLMIININ